MLRSLLLRWTGLTTVGLAELPRPAALLAGQLLMFVLLFVLLRRLSGLPGRTRFSWPFLCAVSILGAVALPAWYSGTFNWGCLINPLPAWGMRLLLLLLLPLLARLELGCRLAQAGWISAWVALAMLPGLLLTY